MIGDKLQQVQARIVTACTAAGRDPASVRLLAVSKTFPAEAVREAHAAGQTAFGENYVQEGVAKIEALADLRGRARMALHRPAAEQQDAAGGRAFRLGAQHRPAQDRRAPGRAAAGASAAAAGVPAGQCGRRRQQVRRGGRGGAVPGARCGGVATFAAARADGDPGAGAGFRGAARGVPACRGAFRADSGGRHRARHAVAGHVGRPRSRGRGGQHDGARGHGDLRRAERMST